MQLIQAVFTISCKPKFIGFICSDVHFHYFSEQFQECFSNEGHDDSYLYREDLVSPASKVVFGVL